MVKMGVMGQSGHTNIADYRHGVLVGNWYENMENKAKSAEGEHLLGFGDPFSGEGTTAAAQHPEGRVGAALADSYTRTDLTRVGKCVPAPLKFSHGDPHEPPIECFATLNQLAFGEKCLGEPQVQAYLWSGKNNLNATVPISSSFEGQGLSSSKCDSNNAHSRSGGNNASCHTLSEAKRCEWQQVLDDDRYSSTAQTMAEAVALATASNVTVAKAQVPASEGGPAPVGRRPVGAFVKELNKSYHVMQLRK